MFYVLSIGIFTAPLAGTWSISFSLYSDPDPGDYNDIYLYKNGQQIPESYHRTIHSSGGSGWSGFTGGRIVFLSLDAGDTALRETRRTPPAITPGGCGGNPDASQRFPGPSPSVYRTYLWSQGSLSIIGNQKTLPNSIRQLKNCRF